jgi:hypothetical protein
MDVVESVRLLTKDVGVDIVYDTAGVEGLLNDAAIPGMSRACNRCQHRRVGKKAAR